MPCAKIGELNKSRNETKMEYGECELSLDLIFVYGGIGV